MDDEPNLYIGNGWNSPNIRHCLIDPRYLWIPGWFLCPWFGVIRGDGCKRRSHRYREIHLPEAFQTRPGTRKGKWNGALAEIRAAFLKLSPLQILAVAMAPVPLTSPGFTHIGYHLGRGTSRHVSVEETQRTKLPRQLRLEMTHHLLLGGHVQEVSPGSKNLTDSILDLFLNVKTEVRKVAGIFGPGVVASSTKMEQKPVFEKPGGQGIKSNRPTYAGAWPRRLVFRCVTALSYIYRFGKFGATVEGCGVATQSCPMG